MRKPLLKNKPTSDVAERPRQCIACRQILPRNQLIRLTYSRRLEQFFLEQNPPPEGRSAYVCRQTTCLGDALKGKKFQRTLKREIPDDIVRSLKDQLEGLRQ